MGREREMFALFSLTFWLRIGRGAALPYVPRGNALPLRLPWRFAIKGVRGLIKFPAGSANWRGIARYLDMLIAVAIGYFVFAKLGLQLASVNPSASPIWPPTGIALAAMLVVRAAHLAGDFDRRLRRQRHHRRHAGDLGADRRSAIRWRRWSADT